MVQISIYYHHSQGGRVSHPLVLQPRRSGIVRQHGILLCTYMRLLSLQHKKDTTRWRPHQPPQTFQRQGIHHISPHGTTCRLCQTLSRILQKIQGYRLRQEEMSKREVAAHYDNACLYNDFVVAQLMEKYKNEDAIVIYYPDHGIDVFQSSPNYFGHAHGFKKESRKTGLQIPCFIYLSPLYKDHHKALTAQTQRSLDRKYCTADMTFTLMHVAGYDFAQHPTDTLYSLIK